MIKPITTKDLAGVIFKLPDDQIFLDKINELCDVVNEQQKQIDKMSCAILDLATPNGENKALENIKAESKTPVDPYAEQRKWVGKLCKFWFADAEHPTFGILDFVDAGLHPEPFHTDCGESEQGWYPHCEPVKADSDIIYKGCDNEK